MVALVWNDLISYRSITLSSESDENEHFRNPQGSI
jgi:hypothetical protein